MKIRQRDISPVSVASLHSNVFQSLLLVLTPEVVDGDSSGPGPGRLHHIRGNTAIQTGALGNLVYIVYHFYLWCNNP